MLAKRIHSKEHLRVLLIVTGAAGFIGSHLVEQLSERGYEIIAVDCMLENSYSARIKRQRFEYISRLRNVRCIELDLRYKIPKKLFEGAGAIINLAAMPGLMKSWTETRTYFECNVIVVDNLLQFSRESGGIPLLQISTSSVYGERAVNNEESELNPISPYGISKLSAEQLIKTYGELWSIPYCILRYHSVYGPHQRPDMAFHIICESILNNKEIIIYGDGSQIRSNTFVTDAAFATVLALDARHSNEIFNVTGLEETSLIDAIRIIEESLGKKAILRFEPARPGDQSKTTTSYRKAFERFGYSPQVDIENGLHLQARWHLSMRA